MKSTVNDKQIFNPYLPLWEYIPDGEPRVFGERLYIFGSHDEFSSKDYCVNDYVCWSAPVDDLSAWRYEGVIFRKDQTPWNKEHVQYYAPDVVQGPDERYYLFYFVKNTSIISVAVCDEPAGKYEYLGDVRRPDGRVYGSDPDDWFTFDPAVLVDDGRIWLYTGSGQPSNGQFGHEIKGCFVMELEQDMLTMKSEPQILLPADWSFKEANFFEGASARHIGDWYYLVYPATNMTGLNYARSRYPDRDFVHMGAIHSSSDIGYDGRTMGTAVYPFGNNHGGLVKIKEDWYIFDHRMTNGDSFSRQGVAEKIELNEDGTIDMVEATSCGLNDGPLNGSGTYPASIACHLTGRSIFGKYIPLGGPMVTQDGADYHPQTSWQDGVEINGETEVNAPVSYIKKIKKGSVIGYKYFDLSQTEYVEVTVRNGEGRLEVCNDLDGEIIGTIRVHRSDVWKTFGVHVNPRKWKIKKKKDGKNAYPLYFRYQGKGELELKEITLS